MELKVGDKVRVISHEEALEVYEGNDSINFDVFKRDGNKVGYITNINYRDVVRISGGDCYRVTSLKKINSFDMKLDENLFEI